MAPVRSTCQYCLMKHHKRFHHGKSVATRMLAATTRSNHTVVDVDCLREDVAVKAYLIYVNQGCPQGLNVQHWLEAEAQTMATSEAGMSAS